MYTENLVAWLVIGLLILITRIEFHSNSSIRWLYLLIDKWQINPFFLHAPILRFDETGNEMDNESQINFVDSDIWFLILLSLSFSFD